MYIHPQRLKLLKRYPISCRDITSTCQRPAYLDFQENQARPSYHQRAIVSVFHSFDKSSQKYSTKTKKTKISQKKQKIKEAYDDNTILDG